VAGFSYDNIPATNLVLDSGTEVTGSGYRIKAFNIDTEASTLDVNIDTSQNFAYLIPGKKYTMVADITPAENAKYFSIHVCNGMYNLTSWIPLEGTERQLVQKTFTAPSYPYKYTNSNTGEVVSYECTLTNT
jgi:hypothetical protein